jgi:Na+-translocating ferredoxin:NAD+ oxidoreductase RnfC subunit
MLKILKRISCLHSHRHSGINGDTTTQTCMRCGKSWTFPLPERAKS